MRKGFLLRALLLISALVLLAAPALAGGAITVYESEHPVEEGGYYSSMEEVAVYLTLYSRLPDNYITKNEADALGWKTKGDLDEVAPGCSIGGDYFGNYEGQLPTAKGLKYTECDIDYTSGSRNAKRVIFSNDGHIYYTDDHYSTFSEVEVVTGGEADKPKTEAAVKVKKKGEYTTAAEVAAYINEYGRLPSNYITRDEAKALGWSSKKDNLGEAAPGKAIGGDKFGNREGLLPDKKGREWFECDVNVEAGKRGDERVVYSDDGLIYYTDDGHRSFTRLY